ncbi:NAD(+) diphosphatase [Paenibacillus mesotrionivorans]|uniref:NAD(+) diphosphatase n=1 Tax=Paenibacillus mesotrionivorans TaxID=3160968 RepID=A0ACC7NZC5_9BACL
MLAPRESIYTHYQPAYIPDHEPGAAAYWFISRTGNLLIRETADGVEIPEAAESGELGLAIRRTQYVGTWKGTPCYAASAESEIASVEGLAFHPLRSLYGKMDEGLFHLAGRAVQLAAFGLTHRFCGTCGTETVPSPKEHALLCPACGSVSFPRLAPAVITVILKDRQVLLARAKHFTNNMYGLIAGFVEPGETLEDCVRRETKEEIGIIVTNIRYFGSQQWPFPHSLMIGFIADYESGEIHVDGEEIVEAGWFDSDKLPVIPSPVSIARKMLDWYVEQYAG